MVKILFTRLLPLFLLTFFLACSSEPVIEKQENPFFDLKAYFKNEVQRLTEQRVKKIITLNGKVEEKTLESLNFEEELSIFMDSDINRKAWFDKYEIDSTLNGQQLQKISYTAKEQELKTQQVDISFHNNKPTEIIILNQTANPIANTNESLHYTPTKGYVIKHDQQQILSDAKEMMVEVLFLE